MSVYVDDMRAKFGRLVMCHMLADTDAELHAMADRIGVARRWWQSPEKTSGSHYDIALSKRALAVQSGAIEITWRQASAMNARRRVCGELGPPETALAWLIEHREKQRRANALQTGPADPPAPCASAPLTNALVPVA
ncbi:MAG: DUF4031 domain-containing protein [Comamonadaceae bacterium]|jgi:hypothetical protein|uniref:DUF4031 domain-containing protein n=1 Tax=Hydrogenophaga sp. PML113 TaxID=1899350 RepID=UPI0009F5F299|nr:DUF4031 domain-containing protein [Hydrogenophaga sp. PML113]NCT98712.1 DUF4031 domain-containing protein [Comamonadaceae bacterium]